MQLGDKEATLRTQGHCVVCGGLTTMICADCFYLLPGSPQVFVCAMAPCRAKHAMDAYDVGDRHILVTP